MIAGDYILYVGGLRLLLLNMRAMFIEEVVFIPYMSCCELREVERILFDNSIQYSRFDIIRPLCFTLFLVLLEFNYWYR